MDQDVNVESNFILPGRVLLGHPSIFTARELAAYEKDILANPSATEREASQFFDRFPKFLCLGTAREIRREAVLFSPDGRPLGRVDFFRRDYGKKVWDMVELKGPNASVVVSEEAIHPGLSAPVNRAISQIIDYRELLDENSDIRLALAQRGIIVHLPRMLLIIGKAPTELTRQVFDKLVSRTLAQRVTLMTYSDVFDFAKEHYESNKHIVLPVNFSRPSIAGDLSSSADSFEQLLQRLMEEREHVFGLFYGKFTHAIDARMRVVVPSMWRSVEAEQFYGIAIDSLHRMHFFGPRAFQGLVEGIKSLGVSPRRQEAFRRQLTARFQRYPIDRHGRIQLSEEIWSTFRASEILLVGEGDSFTLWNPKLWDSEGL